MSKRARRRAARAAIATWVLFAAIFAPFSHSPWTLFILMSLMGIFIVGAANDLVTMTEGFGRSRTRHEDALDSPSEDANNHEDEQENLW